MMQYRAYAHWANWIIWKAHVKMKSCQNCSWEKYVRALISCPRLFPQETCKHIDTDTKTHIPHAMWHFAICKSNIILWLWPVLSLDISPLSISLEPVGLWHSRTSTRSVWHWALWWDAPWPALIHKGANKWRGRKTDRSKDSLSEEKANRR